MLADETFLLESSFLSKIWFIIVITSLTRFKYYFAWTLADAVCNASGFGFTGYDEKGDQCWDLLDNIDILRVEVKQPLILVKSNVLCCNFTNFVKNLHISINKNSQKLQHFT